MVTIKEIRKICREMLKKHETKHEGLFAKHKNLVLHLISGCTIAICNKRHIL